MKKIFFAQLWGPSGAQRILDGLQPKLQDLEIEMKMIGTMENKVEALVELFKVISPLQDRGGFSEELWELKRKNRRGKYDRQVEALGSLQAYIRNAGRSLCGMNRTVKGEEVTAEKVFLGNVYGLWTCTAAYWLKERPRLEKSLRHDLVRNSEEVISDWYLINDYQCGNFLRMHVEGILEQIQILKTQD